MPIGLMIVIGAVLLLATITSCIFLMLRAHDGAPSPEPPKSGPFTTRNPKTPSIDGFDGDLTTSTR